MNAKTDPPRTARRYWTALLKAAFILLVLYLFFSGWQSYRHIRSLRTRVGVLRGLTFATLDTVEPALLGMQHDLAALRRNLALPLALAPHLKWIPRYGPTLGAAPALLVGTEALLDASTLAWGVINEPLIAVGRGAVSLDQAAPQLAEQVGAHQPTLQRAAERAHQGCALFEEIEANALVAPLTRILAQAQPALPLVTAAFDGLLLWPRLAQGEQTYLVLAQNNDELRPTGGFISSIGAITLREGWPNKLSFRDSYEIENWDVPHPDPPDALRTYMELDLWATRDANWWPDFPTSAQAVLDLYRLNQNVAPKGVLALDVYAAAKLMDALAPLEVPGQPTLMPGEALDRFRQSWGLSPDSLITEGVIITATRPYTAIEVALHFSQRPGQVWLDTVRLERANMPGANLLGNPSFELDANGDALPDDWVVSGLSAPDGLVADRAHSGARSLMIVGDPAANKIVSQRINATGAAGDSFVLAAESAAEGAELARGAYALSATFYYAEGATETVVADFPPFTHDWATAGTARIMGDWWRHRKDFLNWVMQAAMAKLASTPADVNWPIVLSTLAEMLEQRHIQLYAVDPELQSWAEAYGWAGALASVEGDYLLLVDSNVGFNKVTANIEQALDYRVIFRPGTSPHARFTVRYKHRGAPRALRCDKFSQYAPTYDALTQGCYWDYVRLYAPPGAELVAASGGDEAVRTTAELGRTVFATSLTMRPGEERTLMFEYRLPDSVLRDGAYHLTVQRQSGAQALPLRLTLEGTTTVGSPPSGWALDAEAPASPAYTTTLLTDRTFEIELLTKVDRS